MRLKENMAVNPRIREAVAIRDKALAGDLLWVLTPATSTPSPTAAAWTSYVNVELQTAAGEVHEWFNDAITTGNSIADTGGGTATIVSTTLTLVNGKARIAVSGDAATWANGETWTYTVPAATILGYTAAEKTSIATFTT